MNGFSLALVWLGFFASIFLGWYYYLKARNKERMSLIERDKDVSEIYAKREFRFRFPWLKLGLLITGIAFGGTLIVSLSAISEVSGIIEKTQGFAFFVALMLFGGISMIIAHYIDKPKNK